jgi:hypothetical protein
MHTHMPNAEQSASTPADGTEDHYPGVPCETTVSDSINGTATNDGSHANERREQSEDVTDNDDQHADNITICTHNLRGLYPKLAAAVQDNCDIYGWQEANVHCRMMGETRQALEKHGYEIHYGQLSKPTEEEGAQQRVAVATRTGVPAYALKYKDPETLSLADSGRWVERAVPTSDGTRYIIVASLYGISGASGDPTLARLNERLIKASLMRAAQFTTTPYVLCADLNMDPATVSACKTMFETGVLSDLPVDWATDAAQMQPTY